MPAMDVFSMTDQLEDAILDVMAEQLETRGAHPRFVTLMDDYLDAMAIDEAREVLDIGCGTGIVARAIVKRADFAGRVVGVDLSTYLVKAASRFSTEEGLADSVRFQAGDTRSLGFEDDSFHAIVAHTLMSHVPGPATVLGEAARLVRPGGAVGAFDGDFASLSFESENTEDAAQNDARLVGSVSSQPRVMRRLPRLARDAGLSIERNFAYGLMEVGQAEFWESSVHSLGALLPKAGVMTQEEADDWVASQMRASEEGVFFGTSNYYGSVLRMP